MYSQNDEPTKSFNELQSDILGEKITNNPLMKASKMVAKNKALNTKQKTVINAINELLTNLGGSQAQTEKSLAQMYDVLGDFAQKPELTNELTSRGVETVLALAAKAYDDVQVVKNLAQDDYEDVFHIAEGQTQSEFVLTHKPIGKIRMYIDGIRYFHECIEYSPDTNTVKWVNDSSKEEGFDITDADVVIEYDYSASEEAQQLALFKTRRFDTTRLAYNTNKSLFQTSEFFILFKARRFAVFDLWCEKAYRNGVLSQLL